MANLAKASSEPGLYKGTYPSVLRVPEGEEVKKAGAREAKEITSACVFIFLAAVAFIYTTPATPSPSPSSTHAGDDLAIIFIFPVVRKESELATSSTPNRGRGASQGSVGRSHGAPVHLRKLGRLIFYLLSVFLHIACTRPPLAFGDPSSVSPRCCSSTLMVATSS